jgi:ATP-dependent RNA helicase DDX46/PRP5
MDDFAESGRKLVKLGEMPAVDLTVDANATSIGENLEADEDDEDNSAVNSTDVDMKSAEDRDDEDDIDPLDAFMTDVNQEVKKVNAQDRAKIGGKGQTDGAAEGEEDEEEEVAPAPDELDTTDMRPEDILAYGPLIFPFITLCIR